MKIEQPWPSYPTYDVIVADPPWQYKAWKGDRGARTAESYYPTMTTRELFAFGDRLRPELAKNAALFLWVTPPFLLEGLRLIGAWGFTYKTVAFQWVKTTTTGKLHFGMGHYTRANSEPCLLGIRGKMPVENRGIPQVVMTEVEEHSKKPNEVLTRVELLYPGRRYLELFARPPFRAGWDHWGNE